MVFVENMASMEVELKVAFICTNYNNSSYTVELVKSISAISSVGEFRVIVVDNCSEPAELEILQRALSVFPELHLIENAENVGYFPGLNVGLDYLQCIDYRADLVIVGNNDLLFPEGFCETLALCKMTFANYAVVSPDLITLDGVHQNPHVVRGISRLRSFVWDLYYSNYWLAILIKCVAFYTRKFTGRRDSKWWENGGVISQGYGACYILTPMFFRHFKRLSAPTFLMGEEFFLKKQLESKGLSTYYEPAIKVHHHDHATVNRVPSKKLWEISRDSHKVYKRFARREIEFHDCS